MAFEEGDDFSELALRGVARPRGAIVVGCDRTEDIGWGEMFGALVADRRNERVAELLFEGVVAVAFL